MKNIFTYLLVLVSLVSNAQDIKSDGNNGFTLISKAEGMSKLDIYQKAKEWIALNYNSANNVIQLDTENKIIVKGSGSFFLSGLEFKSNHTFSISIKEGRFKSDYVYTTFEDSGHTNASLGLSYQPTITPFNLQNMNMDFYALPQKKQDSILLSIKNIVMETPLTGISKKKALKIQEETLSEMTSSMNDLYHSYLGLKKKASYRLINLSEYIQKSKSDDDW